METGRDRTTRETILAALRNRGQRSIAELAGELGISSISVRHHLTVLQAEGLIEASPQRHGVGRPRLVYRLTEAGLERFPTKYLALTNQLLQQIKERLPGELVEQLFRDMAAHAAAEVGSQLEGLSMDERLEGLLQILSAQGFEARAEPLPQGGYRVTELNCPYYRISLQHPEVCTLDASIISQALNAPVQRQSCILRGDRSCTFAILPAAQASPPSAA